MNTYIIDAIRTPIGNFGGTLKDIRTDDLAAIPIRELVSRNKIDPKKINDVILGCANQAGEDNRNIARMASLLANYPITSGGETVNRLCSSGMASVINSARAIKDGAGDIYVAGGVENMTRGPWVISKVSKPFGRDAQMHDSSFGWRFINPKMKEIYGVDGMGVTAENLVDKYGITRDEQDAFALWSQQKATAARESGRLAEEIIAVTIPRRKQDDLIFDQDEFIKPNSSLEILSKLRPAFRKEGGSVTAGNASGLNDGAAAVLVMSEQKANECGLKPLGSILGHASSAHDPEWFTTAPSKVIKKLLNKVSLDSNDIDLWEINEAFSVVSMAAIEDFSIDKDKVNIYGGAVALGHPIGASGARILTTLLNGMERTDSQLGLATLCIGGGEASALIIEKND